MYTSRFDLILEAIYNQLDESRRFPISFRTDNFKNLERKLIDAFPEYREQAAELYRKFSEDPIAAGLDTFNTDIHNPNGSWYKLGFKLPKVTMRAMGFEPRAVPGLIIWDWIGTHQDYDKIWHKKATDIPSVWQKTRAPHDIKTFNFDYFTPGLRAAVENALQAKSLNLPMGQAQMQAKVRRAAAARSTATRNQQIARIRDLGKTAAARV